MRVVRQIIYEADTEQEAFEKARKKLGLEAVVLSSIPVKRGGFLGLFKKRKYIVTAGILEEEENHKNLGQEKRDRLIAFQKLLESTSARSEPGEDDLWRLTNNFSDAIEFSEVAVDLLRDSCKMGQELGDKNAETEGLFAVLTKDSNDISENQICELLLQRGFDPLIAMETARDYFPLKDDKKLDEFVAESIPVVGNDFISALGGKKAMFIGPTGVGKTTTIAKLAAIFALWHQKKVLLLGADTYRIAAVEQLRTYASILEVPMEVVSSSSEIEKALNMHNAEIILVDLPGRSQRDIVRLEEYRKVYDALCPDCVHLLIAANISYPTMVDVVEKLKIVPYDAIIFTKVDETTSLGDLFRLTKTCRVPLSYITTGQDVPRDVEVASPNRIARLALGLERLCDNE